MKFRDLIFYTGLVFSIASCKNVDSCKYITYHLMSQYETFKSNYGQHGMENRKELININVFCNNLEEKDCKEAKDLEVLCNNVKLKLSF